MSATRIFETFKRPATKTEIAMQIAMDTIEEHQLARTGREDQPWDAHDTDRMQRLAALLVGPHKDAVTPIVLKAYPQMAALINRIIGHVSLMPACEACFGSGDSDEISAMSAFGPHLYWPCKTCNGAPTAGVITGLTGDVWAWHLRDVKSAQGMDRRAVVESKHIAPGSLVTFVGTDDHVATQIDVIEADS